MQIRKASAPFAVVAGLAALAACGGERVADNDTELEIDDVLEIEVTVPEEVRVGEEYTVTATVENEADHALHGVRLRSVGMQSAQQKQQSKQKQQAGMQQASMRSQQQDQSDAAWYIGTLQPGEEKTLTRTMRAAVAGEERMCWYAEYDPAVCLTVMKVQPQLSIERQILLEQDAAWACDDVQLRYSITNTGTAAFKSAAFIEQLPQGVTVKDADTLEYEVERLEPGESLEKTVTLDIAQSGTYTFEPEVRIGDLAVETPAQQIRILKPELDVTLSGPAETYVGREVAYQLNIENTSSDPAVDIDVELDGLEDINRLSSEKLDDGQLTISRIGAGATRTINISGIAAETGALEVRAAVDGYCVDAVDRTLATNVKGVPALRLETFDEHDPVAVGETTTYEITLLNQGSAEDVDVDIKVKLPDHLEFADSDGPTKIKTAGRKLTFGRLADIPAGESRTWNVHAKAVKAGNARLQLQLTSADVKTPLLEHEPTTIVARGTEVED